MAEVRGLAAVLLAIDAERAALREEIRSLDEAAKLLRPLIAGDEAAASPAKARTRSGGRPRGRPKGSRIDRTPAAVEKREREIHRFLVAQGPSYAGEISAALPGMGDKARLNALRRLEAKGLVRKRGHHKKPIYEATEAPRPAAPTESQPATLGGRVLALIQESDGVSEAELVARTGASGDEVKIECRRLIAEGEIRYERRGDLVVYVSQAGA
jgi:hypothetical protein